MFKRKKPLDFWQTMRQALWPAMGWLRLLHYYRLRVIRLSSTTHNIAANLASGAAISFTPFFGFHILGSMGFSWLIGAGMNLIAATVGTFVGNPWTFPFLFFISYMVGKWVLDITGVITVPVDISPQMLEQRGETILEKLVTTQEGESLFQHFINNTWDIFLPTAVGGTIMMLVSWPVYYYIFYYMVQTAQKARRLRMKRGRDGVFDGSTERNA